MPSCYTTAFTPTGSIPAKKKVELVTRTPGGKALQTEGTPSAKSLLRELTWSVWRGHTGLAKVSRGQSSEELEMSSERDQIIECLVKLLKCLSFYSQRNVEPLRDLGLRNGMAQWTSKRIILGAMWRPHCRTTRVDSGRSLGEAVVAIWEINNSNWEYGGCAESMFVAYIVVTISQMYIYPKFITLYTLKMFSFYVN